MLLRRGGQWQVRVCVALEAVEASFRDGVEEGDQAVKIFLPDGIELVVVATRATHGETQPGGARGACPVDHVLRMVFRGNGAAFKVDHVIAVEAGGDLVVEGGVGQQIARQLLDGELVVPACSGCRP